MHCLPNSAVLIQCKVNIIRCCIANEPIYRAMVIDIGWERIVPVSRYVNAE